MTDPLIEITGKKRKFDDSSRLLTEVPVDNKEKRKRSDAYSRIASNTKTNGANQSGRGSEAGWTYCPLCFPFSKKMFAQGRGVASHLHVVHTPWKEPSKAERKRRQKKERLVAAAAIKDNNKPSNSSWEPSTEEVDLWNAKVLQIVKDLEEKPLLPDASSSEKIIRKGVDRIGKIVPAYRSSLPPFLQAAANGDLAELKKMVASKTSGGNKAILEELNRTDRHLSIAEHWAAGGGHLECLKFLLETRKRVEASNEVALTTKKPKEKLRRRDGKTALHYAARNGQVQCIHYLIQEHGHAVDEVSGDGSTPLHLACYGGHLEAMESLIHGHGANAQLSNEWDCSAAHWVGMTKCESTEQVRKMCRLLQTAGVSFVKRQKQGHTAIHKAAQRQNKHVIAWLAQQSSEGGAGMSDEDKQKLGGPDEGGHTPSEIWLSVGGDPEFGEWMKTKMGW